MHTDEGRLLQTVGAQHENQCLSMKIVEDEERDSVWGISEQVK